MTERPTCRTCPYWYFFDQETGEETAWKDENDDAFLGECRRHPPTNFVFDNAYKHLPEAKIYAEETEYPALYPDQWCGEHPDFPAYLSERKAREGALQELVDQAQELDMGYGPPRPPTA